MCYPFDYGDPYIEWNEEISTREPDYLIERHKMFDELKADVANLLVIKYDFTMEEAEERVDASAESGNSDLWDDDSEAADIAKVLATDEADD